jgi:chromosome segregation ATPase
VLVPACVLYTIYSIACHAYKTMYDDLHDKLMASQKEIALLKKEVTHLQSRLADGGKCQLCPRLRNELQWKTNELKHMEEDLKQMQRNEMDRSVICRQCVIRKRELEKMQRDLENMKRLLKACGEENVVLKIANEQLTAANDLVHHVQTPTDRTALKKKVQELQFDNQIQVARIARAEAEVTAMEQEVKAKQQEVTAKEQEVKAKEAEVASLNTALHLTNESAQALKTENEGLVEKCKQLQYAGEMVQTQYNEGLRQYTALKNDYDALVRHCRNVEGMNGTLNRTLAEKGPFQ